MIVRRKCVWCCAVALLICELARGARAAEPPRFVGRAGCATATCHGGVIGRGPAWHSSASVFESRDPHAWAGVVLQGGLSRRIVAALEPEAAASENVFASVLQTRCAGCHAPEILSTTNRPDAVNGIEANRIALAAGVSCEACHGPASNWLQEHTRVGWEDSDRFAVGTGMLNTESLLARTDNCSRCHVGSRTADGHVRDMNHDMLAAGHPPLTFDTLGHQRRLPAHWRAETPRRDSFPSQNQPGIDPAGEESAVASRVLLAAIRLSHERRADRAQLPQPELSEYDCQSCHHALRLNTFVSDQDSTGAARWQPWYMAGIQSEALQAELRLGHPRSEQSLRRLEEWARSQQPPLPAVAERSGGER